MVRSARCSSNNPANSRQGLSRASQRCKILKGIPIALVYDQTASKSGLTLPVHLSPSLVKSADSFANLSSLFLFLLPLFSSRGLRITPRNLFLCLTSSSFFSSKVHQVFVINGTSLLTSSCASSSRLFSDHFD